MRDMTIETVDGEDEGVQDSSWAEVAGDRAIRSITACNFDVAEEVIALIKYQDGSYEVGIGESLRPYSKLYDGVNLSGALDRFWQAIRLHAEG